MSTMAPAVEGCMKVITYLSEQNMAVGISNISTATGINKNMVSRILHTLEEGGWVNHDEHVRYALTLLPFCITSKVVERSSFVNDSFPILREFWKQYGESTFLGILQNDHVLYQLHFDSVQTVKVAGAVGGCYPLYCTAPGKILLAYSDEKFISDYIATHTLERCTDNTFVEGEALKAELAQIRRVGYSLDREEFGVGIVCIAAPVFDGKNHVIGTIGCSLTKISHTWEDLYDYCGKDLVLCAEKISKAMGYLL